MTGMPRKSMKLPATIEHPRKKARTRAAQLGGPCASGARLTARDSITHLIPVYQCTSTLDTRPGASRTSGTRLGAVTVLRSRERAPWSRASSLRSVRARVLVAALGRGRVALAFVVRVGVERLGVRLDHCV